MKLENEINDPENQGLRVDYENYTLSSAENALTVILASGAVFAVLYLIYGVWWIALCGTPLALLAPRWRRRQAIASRKQQLNLQFRDLLYSISGSLQGSMSMENAFLRASGELQTLYPDPNTPMLVELQLINSGIQAGYSLDDLLADFAHRSHLEDIVSFVEVYRTVRQTGGNLIAIIQSTTNVIADKINTKMEIDLMLAQTKSEQRMMNILPFGIIVVLNSISPGYLGANYGTVMGFITSTIVLVLFAIAYVWGERITSIKI